MFEVGNILGLKQPAAAHELLAAMIDLRLPEETPAAYLPGLFQLMSGYGVTAYDASYHALAVHRHGTMLTADRRYVRKAGRAGHIALLDEWRLPSV